METILFIENENYDALKRAAVISGVKIVKMERPVGESYIKVTLSYQYDIDLFYLGIEFQNLRKK